MAASLIDKLGSVFEKEPVDFLFGSDEADRTLLNTSTSLVALAARQSPLSMVNPPPQLKEKKSPCLFGNAAVIAMACAIRFALGRAQ